MCHQVFGGPSHGKYAVLTRSAKIFTSFAHFGFSNHFAAHIYRCFLRQEFCSYDWGPEKNLKVLGQKEPINVMANFDLIDIPICYYLSLEDNLCRPDDVMVQYVALREAKKELASVKVFDGYSHIDFTYLNHHSMISEIMKTLKGKEAATTFVHTTNEPSDCESQFQKLLSKEEEH
mmetsp:Transcript_24675/g.38381  ORF Transcript_24675/g.38381 Transcript_24675/m.38381 type:complete len:176 (+) Transcript_24675:1959-2486(+)